jgi:hypothetical protein
MKQAASRTAALYWFIFLASLRPWRWRLLLRNVSRLPPAYIYCTCTALPLIYTLQFTVTDTHWGSQSSLVVTWQRMSIQYLVQLTHVKSSLYRLTFRSQLNPLPSLLNHLPLQSQENCLSSFSAKSKSVSKSWSSFVGALSDERTGLPFVYGTAPCQCSLPRVWVPWDIA